MSRQRRVRSLLLAGMAGAVVLTVYFLISSAPVEPPPSTSPDAQESGVEVSIRDFNMEESEEGRMSWHLKADLAKKMPDENQVHLENLELVLFMKDGRRVTITGDEGMMDNEAREMTVRQNERGPTRVLFDDGSLLTTSTLHWSDGERVASTDDPVVLERKGMRLTGTGMRANLDLQQVEVKSDVKAVIGVR